MFSELVGSTALSARMDPEDFARDYLGLPQSASRRRCIASAASWRSTWATASSCTSAIRRPTSTTPSEPCAQALEMVGCRGRPQDPRRTADARRDRYRAGRCWRLVWIITFATGVLGGSGSLAVGLQMLATLASVQISYLFGCLLAAHLPVRSGSERGEARLWCAFFTRTTAL